MHKKYMHIMRNLAKDALVSLLTWDVGATQDKRHCNLIFGSYIG